MIVNIQDFNINSQSFWITILSILTPLIIAVISIYLTYQYALKQIAAKKKHEVYVEAYSAIVEYALSADMLSISNDINIDEAKAKNKVAREQVCNLYLKHSIYFSKDFDDLCQDYLQKIIRFSNYYLIPRENNNNELFKEICNIKEEYIKELIILDKKINFNNKIKLQIRKDLELAKKYQWKFWEKINRGMHE